MKKLNKILPDVQVKYLDNGRGQEVRYIQLPKLLSLSQFEQDVDNGAVQYKECLELVKNNPDHVIAIKCNNREEGLMAVSYMAAVLNSYEGAMDSEEEMEEHRADATLSGNKENISYEDTPFSDFNPYFDDDYEEDRDGWVESRFRIPIIPYDELDRIGDGKSFHNDGNSLFTGVRQPSEPPYWTEIHEHPVCVWVDVNSMVGYLPFMDASSEDVRHLERFDSNKYVFVVLNEQNLLADFEECNNSVVENITCNLMLNYSADVVKITMDKDKREEYYVNLFENWVKTHGRRLKAGFPKKDIVKKIISIREPNKSELMNKVLKYVNKTNKRMGITRTELTKNDFDILQNFKALGVEAESHKVSNHDKLRNELAGMEEVKQQIEEIVGVMKYNKLREEAGLGKGSYHNVHLLIGAPGTAKSTVARLMGNIMCDEHLLPGNRFISINGCDLKGLYVGHTAAKVKSIFKENDIIFIDEAYSVTTVGQHDSFSEEAISELIIQMEEHSTDKLIMLAGYGGMNVSDKDNKMKVFIDANPGIKSRINSTIYFDSFAPKQMVEIVHKIASNLKFNITTETDAIMEKYFESRVGDRNFGNGREARSLVENMSVHAAARISKLGADKITKKMLQEITKEDVISAIEKLKKDHVLQVGNEKKLGFVGGNK